MRHVVLIHFLRTSSVGGGALPDFFFCSLFPVQQTRSGIGHRVFLSFFLGLPTNTLIVRNNDNIAAYTLYCGLPLSCTARCVPPPPPKSSARGPSPQQRIYLIFVIFVIFVVVAQVQGVRPNNAILFVLFFCVCEFELF